MSGSTTPVLIQIPSLGTAGTPLNTAADLVVVSQSGIARKLTVDEFITGGKFATLGTNTFTGKQTIVTSGTSLEVTGLSQFNTEVYLPINVNAATGMDINSSPPSGFPLLINSNLTGTYPDRPNPLIDSPYLNYIICRDTADFTNAPANSGAVVQISHNLNNGNGGGRNTLQITTNVQGTNINVDPRLNQWSAAAFFGNGLVNVGGTDVSNPTTTRGTVYGIYPQAVLYGPQGSFNGATNWFGVAGGEVDVGILAGASAYHKRGFYVGLLGLDRVSGVGDDFGFGLTTLGSTVGWRNGYSVGQTGGSAGYIINPTTGALFGITTMQNGSASGPKFSLQQSPYGINIAQWVSTEGAFISPGFRVNKDGAVLIGGAKISYTSPTFAIDANGRTTTAATVSGSSGLNTGNRVGDRFYDTKYYGIYQAATIDGNGAVTKFSVVSPSFTDVVGPDTTLTLIGGSGGQQQVKADVTWTDATDISFAASGATTTFGGNVDATGYLIDGAPFASAPAAASNGYQTVLGRDAGLTLKSSAIESTIVGWRAGGSDGVGLTGAENTLIGWHSGNRMTSGAFNTAVGVNTMGFETTGSNNTAVGVDAMRNSVGMIANIAIGTNALRNGAVTVSSVAVGYEALKGDETVPSTSVGSDLIAIGYASMTSATRTTAANVVAIGTRSATAITTGTASVYVGHEAGKAVTSSANAVGVGYQSLLKLTTGGGNVAVGRNTLNEITTETGNVAAGNQAGKTVIGKENVFVGLNSGITATTANYNVAIGSGTGTLLQSDNNVILGAYSGVKITTGANNVLIGPAVGLTTLATGSNNILIGNSNCDTATSSTSGTLKIANSTVPVMSATGITGTTPVVCFDGGTVTIGPSGSPTITFGSGAPASTQPKGSVYLRTGGGVGSTLYVSQGGGTWNPVAGV
jgi:hypothetical protein